MDETRENKQEHQPDVSPAAEGYGPLLQRDYWAVLRGCSLSCPEVAKRVREQFPAFPPKSLVVFSRPDEATGPLEVGDLLEVNIRMGPDTAVRVVHIDDNSLTLATVKGHPEAGRITFGTYRNDRGDVIFHIRSRARASSSMNYAGFLTAGDAMQTNTWSDFIDCLAHTLANGIIGSIYVEKKKLGEKDVADEGAQNIDRPTFIAEGD